MLPIYSRLIVVYNLCELNLKYMKNCTVEYFNY